MRKVLIVVLMSLGKRDVFSKAQGNGSLVLATASSNVPLSVVTSKHLNIKKAKPFAFLCPTASEKGRG